MMIRLRKLRKYLLPFALLYLAVCGFIFLYISRNNFIDNGTGETLDVRLKSDLSSTGKAVFPYKLNTDAIYDKLAFDNQPGGVWKQGFPISYNQSQWNRQKPLQVFIVPHSHQDPGWIKTFEEYFQQQTRDSLDSTLSVLKGHRAARFIYAEISFFSQWFEQLHIDRQSEVKRLLHSGQWEIVSGGWVMTDEAVSHHYAMIQQLIEGHNWLQENLDYRPTYSWSIDPFGHSSTMAYLAKKMGMGGMVINRVHYEVKKYLAQHRSLEFYWQQPWDTNGETEILTHMMPFFAYDVPHTCGPDPAICCQFDFLRMQKYSCPWKQHPVAITNANVASRAALLADQYRKKATLFNNTDLLLIPLGDDFRYTSVKEWQLQLSNYDQLIDYWTRNPDQGIQAKYGTLSDYFSALRQRSGISHPRLTGDFFTYADVNQDYWSGYFNSRPWQKALSRSLETELRSADILYTIARRGLELAKATESGQTLRLLDILANLTLTTARRQLGLFQHHDGVTGTERPPVALDYSVRLASGLHRARLISALCAGHLVREPVSVQLLQQLIRGLGSADLQTTTADFDQLLPVVSLEDDHFVDGYPEPKPKTFSVPVKERSNKTVYAFNSLFRQRKVLLQLPQLHWPSRMALPSVYASYPGDVDSRMQIRLPVQLTPERTDASSDSDRLVALTLGPLVIPPMTLKQISLVIEPQQQQQEQQPSVAFTKEIPQADGSEDFHLENSGIRLTFSGKTGLLTGYFDKLNNTGFRLSIDFLLYVSSASNSGAYLFVPDSAAQELNMSTDARPLVTRGQLFDQVTLRTPILVHTVRLYKPDLHQLAYFEIENSVKLAEKPKRDTELVMRLMMPASDLHPTSPAFYTDSNCYQFFRREYRTKLPLQGNLYPVSCAVFLQGLPALHQPGPVHRLNLFMSQATGLTSTRPGELQVWLDRRSVKDDNRGLGLPLVGKWTATSRFRVAVEWLDQSVLSHVATPSLSLAAHDLQLDFSSQVQRFLVTPKAGQGREKSPGGGQLPLFPDGATTLLPCDYHLVSLLTLLTNRPLDVSWEKSTGVTAKVGLVIRRLPSLYEPPVGAHEGQGRCLPSTGDELDVAGILKALSFQRVVSTGLTLVPNVDSKPRSHISLKPMELQAYLLTT